MSKLIISSCLLLMAALAGCANTASNNSVTQVNRSPIAYHYERGTANPQYPTIVFQSGLGDDQTVWLGVLQRLGKQASSFSYDRPGYGASAATSMARDPCHIAQEQRVLLKSAGVKPPYILVGHSLGGLYEYTYAQLYPEEVAGLVLLDPTHPQHWQRIQTELPHISTLLSTATMLMGTTARQEFKAQQNCLNQLKPELTAQTPARLLLSSQRQALEQGAFERLIKQLALDWQRITHAPQIQNSPSGHYIQKEQPELVVNAIHELLRIK